VKEAVKGGDLSGGRYTSKQRLGNLYARSSGMHAAETMLRPGLTRRLAERLLHGEAINLTGAHEPDAGNRIGIQ